MAETIKVGMIGCDTSHCAAYARIFGDPNAPEELKGIEVVAAYPSFSPDLTFSAERVEGFKKELVEKFKVRMTGSIGELLEQVDAVLLTSVDGRRHLAELKPVAEAGKPCYIDKPFSASLADARAMVELIKKHKLPCFSSSSLRFDSAVVKFMAARRKERENAKPDQKGQPGTIFGCDAYGPAALEPTNPGFFWYGIHGVEILYAIMGRGCQRVQCTSTPDGDLAVGVWEGGRLGTMRGNRAGPHTYGATVLHAGGHDCLPASGDFYAGLCKAIARLFKTGEVPVPIDETLELCAFIDAALRSSQQGGEDVEIQA